MGGIKSFEDLDCWKMGRQLRNDVKDLIKIFQLMKNMSWFLK